MKSLCIGIFIFCISMNVSYAAGTIDQKIEIFYDELELRIEDNNAKLSIFSEIDDRLDNIKVAKKHEYVLESLKHANEFHRSIYELSDYTKDMGFGFTLTQSEDESTLSYSGSIIKTYTHISESVPFIWDEEVFFHSHMRTLQNIDPDSGDYVWNTVMDSDERLMAMRHNIGISINIEEIQGTELFQVTKGSYGGITYILVNPATGYVSSEGGISYNTQVEKGESGTYITSRDKLFLYNDGVLETIFATNASLGRGAYIQYELLLNKQIRVTYYDEDSGKNIEEIIDMN